MILKLQKLKINNNKKIYHFVPLKIKKLNLNNIPEPLNIKYST